jgi:uridine kinase
MEVEIPIFNFPNGSREPVGKEMMLEDDNILVIEGIHGLNEKLTRDIPKENKFKIYVSALTSMNIDDHNRIPTTDTRIIRRIVRDYRFRGTNAASTIKRWPSVRRGEERNIFPFQESADVMFNSSLMVELGVLKSFAEPLLSEIGTEIPEYSEAKRLLGFLSYFLPIENREIPFNSIIREFIGGSCFY